MTLLPIGIGCGPELPRQKRPDDAGLASACPAPRAPWRSCGEPRELGGTSSSLVLAPGHHRDLLAGYSFPGEGVCQALDVSSASPEVAEAWVDVGSGAVRIDAYEVGTTVFRAEYLDGQCHELEVEVVEIAEVDAIPRRCPLPYDFGDVEYSRASFPLIVGDRLAVALRATDSDERQVRLSDQRPELPLSPPGVLEMRSEWLGEGVAELEAVSRGTVMVGGSGGGFEVSVVDPDEVNFVVMREVPRGDGIRGAMEAIDEIASCDQLVFHRVFAVHEGRVVDLDPSDTGSRRPRGAALTEGECSVPVGPIEVIGVRTPTVCEPFAAGMGLGVVPLAAGTCELELGFTEGVFAGRAFSYAVEVVDRDGGCAS